MERYVKDMGVIGKRYPSEVLVRIVGNRVTVRYDKRKQNMQRVSLGIGLLLRWKSRFREGVHCLERYVKDMGVIGKRDPSEVIVRNVGNRVRVRYIK